jgi:hypothetical protein
LSENVENWKAVKSSDIILPQKALGACGGRAYLGEPDSFENNCGTARIDAIPNQGSRQKAFSIKVVALDDILRETDRP